MKNYLNNSSNTPILKIKPVFLCVSIILGLSTVAQGAITSTNGAGILTQGNGPTIVHIKAPSQNGVSHNIYSAFDVDQKGVILNNSANNSNTQIGGRVGGNANLTNGRAKVILNEVNSVSATTLNGMIEVAGGKAQVIVANASGITCNNCGFINTNRATLTTGNVILANDGSITGYNVEKGKVTINSHFDTNSPTDIIARSIAVNGVISAKNITATAGNNIVNNNGQVVGRTTGAGAQPIVGIDVSAIGGMYADKISLITTENGVGVTNAGNISVGNGGLLIDTSGGLINTSANITSSGSINIKSMGLTNNSVINANNDIDITISNPNTLNNNNGRIEANKGNVNITTLGYITNANGVIKAAKDINTISNTLVNDNGLFKSTNGDINIHSTGAIYNRDSIQLPNNPNKGFIAERDVSINAISLLNENSNVTAGRDLNIKAQSTVDNISNSKITAKRKISVSAMNLTQLSSELNAQNGKMDIDASVSLTNDSVSKIHSGKLINIDTYKLVNTGSIISDNGLSNITTSVLSNNAGYIKAKNLDIKSHDLNNLGGLINAESNLNIETSSLNNTYSDEFQYVNTKFGLTNQNGGLQTNDGAITIKGDTLYNWYGSIAANINKQNIPRNDIDIILKAGLQNNYGAITGANNQKINVGNLDNYAGKIAAGKNLNVDSAIRIENSYGILSSNNTTKITSPTVTNGTTGTISGNKVIVNAIQKN